MLSAFNVEKENRPSESAAVCRTFDKDVGAGYRMAAIGHRTRYHLLCIAEAVARQQEKEYEYVAFHVGKVSA